MIGQQKVLQCNLNKNIQTTEATLQLAIELGVGIIAVQEPWLPQLKQIGTYEGVQSISHPSFSQIFPTITDHTLRPRTMFYISKHAKIQHNQLSGYPLDPDILAVNFKSKTFNMNIINIYNQKNQKPENNLTAMGRYSEVLAVASNTIFVGDFNEHHPNWDPCYPKSRGADSLQEWIEKQGLTVINTVGKGTFYRPHMTSPSVIDLTLATQWSEKYIQDWQTIPTGSDHQGILFTILNQKSNRHQPQVTLEQFNTKSADWAMFQRASTQLFKSSHILDQANFQILKQACTQNLWDKGSNLTQKLDEVGLELTNILIQAAEASIQRKKPRVQPKPWWTADLKKLRRKMVRALKEHFKDYFNKEKLKKYSKARNKYFQEIKIAKQNHWNIFLENEDSAFIFKALKYTKGYQSAHLPMIRDKNGDLKSSFADKCNTLRTELFVTPPMAPELDWSTHKETSWDWPELTSVEVENACCKLSKGKAPGPDQIDQNMICHAYKANNQLFSEIYSLLIKLYSRILYLNYILEG